MKVEMVAANRKTLEAFADEHELVMQVNERTRTDLWKGFEYGPNRYYAAFKDIDIKDGSVIIGMHGNGSTPAAAMADYASKISGKLLVKDFAGNDRKEFYAPELSASHNGGDQHG